MHSARGLLSFKPWNTWWSLFLLSHLRSHLPFIVSLEFSRRDSEHPSWWGPRRVRGCCVQSSLQKKAAPLQTTGQTCC